MVLSDNPYFVKYMGGQWINFCLWVMALNFLFLVPNVSKIVQFVIWAVHLLSFFLKVSMLLLRFLYNRLALVIHCDSHLSSMTLPWQLLSVIKVVLFHQILPHRMWIPHGHAFWGVSLVNRRSLVPIQLSVFFFHLIS